MSESDAKTALLCLSQHDHLGYAIGICDQLGLSVAASARAASGRPIGDAGDALLGLPNIVIASAARNCGYNIEDGKFIDTRPDEYYLDEASVEAIVKVAGGDEDYALALLFRFSRDSEVWYSFDNESASFVDYNLDRESPICNGCIGSVFKTFYCTGAEAAWVLTNANETSTTIATNHLNLFIAKANNPAALEDIKNTLLISHFFNFTSLTRDVAAREPADAVLGIVTALEWVFNVNEDRRYLALMSLPWSRETHTDNVAELQDAVVAVLLVASRLATTAIGIRRSIRNGALAPLPPDLVEAILGHLHPYEFC